MTPLVRPPQYKSAAEINILASTPCIRVHLDISNHLLDVAIQGVLRDRNFALIGDDDRCLVVTDDHQHEGRRYILLSDESPAEAYASVSAFLAGRIGAVASMQQPETLPMVLEGVRDQVAVLPRSLLSAAFDAPRLGERQVRVLALMIEGLTNANIGVRLGLSEPTVKRNVSTLLRAFDCSTRAELVRRASRIGFTNRSV